MIQNLTTVSLLQFTVVVSDQRANEKQAEVRVTVIVTRDDGPPRFSGAPYTTDVSENAAVDQSVAKVFAIDTDQQVHL